jgi:hypothetical protein
MLVILRGRAEHGSPELQSEKGCFSRLKTFGLTGIAGLGKRATNHGIPLGLGDVERWRASGI